MARPSEFSEILRELGLRIQQARITAGLTQEQAASDAGIDYKRWQRLEDGSVNPTVKTLHRVSVALDIPFWEMLSPLPRRRPSVAPRSGQVPKVGPKPRVSGEIRLSKDTVVPPAKRQKSREE